MLPIILLLTMSAPPEVRSYVVEIAGVGTGQYNQTLTDKGDGAIEVVSTSTLRVKKFIISYSYDFTCTEQWRRGTFLSATGQKNDNGAIMPIRTTGACDWTSSFWTLPVKRTGPIKVYDLDTDKLVTCELKFVGIDATGRHWKVTGGIEADLWYDQNGRMVKRTMLRKGRQATVTLKP